MMRPAVIIWTSIVLIVGTIVGAQLSEVGLHPPESDIIFSHENHTDLECADCHTNIASSNSALDRNLPEMDACGDCHDIDTDENCGMCHRNPDDPQESPHPKRTIVFNHQAHIARGTACAVCHDDVATSTMLTAEHMPSMNVCLDCHDGVEVDDDCATCHADHIALLDIHPVGWVNQHGQKAALDRSWCTQCHREENECVDCHRGDNLQGQIHELNYMYTHGLDAKSNRIECIQCHDTRGFCNECHDSANRIPLMHSTMSWRMNHGEAARRDVENCAACHDTADPTCARAGCHNDFDGVRGTDVRYHASNLSLFDSHGPWHNDNGYFCFSCHRDTRSPGNGFCGYCHR